MVNSDPAFFDEKTGVAEWDKNAFPFIPVPRNQLLIGDGISFTFIIQFGDQIELGVGHTNIDIGIDKKGTFMWEFRLYWYHWSIKKTASEAPLLYKLGLHGWTDNDS